MFFYQKTYGPLKQFLVDIYGLIAVSRSTLSRNALSRNTLSAAALLFKSLKSP